MSYLHIEEFEHLLEFSCGIRGWSVKKFYITTREGKEMQLTRVLASIPPLPHSSPPSPSPNTYTVSLKDNKLYNEALIAHPHLS